MPIAPDAANPSQDEDEFDGPDAPDAPQAQNFSDMVRQSPIGAVVGAFVAGFLVSKIL